MKIKALLHQRPYLSAIVAGVLFNAFWARQEIKALMVSAFVVGLCVGLLGSARWQSLLTKFLAALGCFALVAFCVDIAGRVMGRREANMYSVMIMVMTVYSSPLVLGGVLVGWLAKVISSESPPSKNIRAALVLLAALAGSAAAEDGFHVHGFSPDGRYFAFEDFGGYHHVGGYWTVIRAVDSKTDAQPAGPFRLAHPWSNQDIPEVPLGTTRSENLKKAVPSLKKLGLRFDDQGERAEIKDGRFKLRGEAYEVNLTTIAFPSTNCGYGGGHTTGFRLELKGPRGARTLHDEKRVPSGRGRDGCVGGYWLTEIRAKGKYLVVVLGYDMPGDGTHNEHLAVGTRLE